MNGTAYDARAIVVGVAGLAFRLALLVLLALPALAAGRWTSMFLMAKYSPFQDGSVNVVQDLAIRNLGVAIWWSVQLHVIIEREDEPIDVAAIGRPRLVIDADTTVVGQAVGELETFKLLDKHLGPPTQIVHGDGNKGY